jgi:uncharacterized membrane protein (DUF2068 family)
VTYWLLRERDDRLPRTRAQQRPDGTSTESGSQEQNRSDRIETLRFHFFRGEFPLHHGAFIRFCRRHLTHARGSAGGLRIVAAFEAAKGALVLVVGLGLLSFVHHLAQNVGEEIVRRFHLNLAHHYPRIFLDAITHIDDAHLRLLALAALLYSMLRFVEAYGLWRMRAWAEWLAIVSGGVYLPLEVYELAEHATAVKAAVFIVNAGIVAYLIYVRRRHNGHRDAPGPA